MSTCTFFGHRDAPDNIETELYNLLRNLIRNNSVDVFYLGNQGNFDKIALNALKKVQIEYSHVKYAVVLAYLPKECGGDFSNTIYPEGLETVPKKYAIHYRNKWMVDNSDYVVTYINRSFGGAAKYKEYAQRKGKTIINL